jgi:hypothetical protein
VCHSQKTRNLNCSCRRRASSISRSNSGSLRMLAKEIADQFGQVLGLNLDLCSVAVCLGSLSNDEKEPKIEQLQLTEELTEEFAAGAKRAVQRFAELNANNELVLRQYDAGSKPDSYEVEYLELADHDSVETQVNSLSSLAQIPVFKMDDEFVAGLRFYAIAFQCGSNDPPLYFFRMYTAKKELSRPRLFAALFGDGIPASFNCISYYSSLRSSGAGRYSFRYSGRTACPA